MHKLLTWTLAPLVSSVLSAQCISANFSGTLGTTTGVSSIFAVGASTGATAQTIHGLQFRCAARTTAHTTEFSIWGSTASGPATKLRVAKVGIGTTTGVYGVTFAPLTLPANTPFFCGFDNSISGGLILPIMTSGTSQTHYHGTPPIPFWKGPFSTLAWNYNVLCASAGCVSANFDGTPGTIPGVGGNFAILANTGGTEKTICGLQFRCSARMTPHLNTFSIYSATAAGAPSAMLRAGQVIVGHTPELCSASFTPVTIPANTQFFCVIDNSISGGLNLPIMTSGTNQTHFFNGPPNWSGPFTSAAWNYNVVCCGSLYIPDDDATAGNCNVIPFGAAAISATWSNQRYQTMATAADLGSPTGKLRICNIGFASCNTTANISHADTIEIQLGQTDATSLATTFAANLVNNVQTVLKRRDFDWHQQGGEWARIGLDQDYVFDPAQGANLVIDICVTGQFKPLGAGSGFRTGARERLYAITWTGACPRTGTLGSSSALKWCLDVESWSFAHQGQGCNALGLQLQGSAQLGETFSMSTSGAPTTANCSIALGVQPISPGFDLAVAGAPGCLVYLNPLVTIPGTSLKVAVPNDRSLICQRFLFQAYCLDRSYAGGIATSNMAVLVAGNGQ
jgi:hypothetical protein